jgi:hypothetical protein
MLGPSHTAVLNEAVGQFSQWSRGLTPDQRAEQERLAQDYAEEARREAAADAHQVRRPAADDEEWKTRRPILRKRRR